MFKTLIAFSLLALSTVAHAADQIDVFDHAAGYKLSYTNCVVGTGSTTFNAACGSLVIAPNTGSPPANITAFSSFPVVIERVGAFSAVWDLCYLTAAMGLPKGGIYFRLDCLTQPPVFKNGFERVTQK